MSNGILHIRCTLNEKGFVFETREFPYEFIKKHERMKPKVSFNTENGSVSNIWCLKSEEAQGKSKCVEIIGKVMIDFNDAAIAMKKLFNNAKIKLHEIH